jgi:hypothetical protein
MDQAFDRFVAWIESQDEASCTVAFVAATASRRAPATRKCASLDEARQWVELEAEALGGVSIEWIAVDAKRAEGPAALGRG